MHLRILLSNEHRDLSSVFVNVQVSEAYIITGLTNVLYISSFVFLRPRNVLPTGIALPFFLPSLCDL
jgi:hypothetical protein